MTETSAPAPLLAQLDARPADYRLILLAAVADAVLASHVAHLSLRAQAFARDEFATEQDRPLDVSPAAALAYVLDEIGAHLTVNLPGDRGPYAALDYRAATVAAWLYAAELIPGAVASAISSARRGAGLSY